MNYYEEISAPGIHLHDTHELLLQACSKVDDLELVLNSMRTELKTVRLFNEQSLEKEMASRSWPRGRIGGKDDGALAIAVAADHRHKIVRIRFGKPVEWIGLDPISAKGLIDNLARKLAALEAK